MYAFGDAVVFLAVFAIASLVPTGYALYWLRANRSFWSWFAIATIAIASTAVFAGAADALTRTGVLAGPGWTMVAGISILRMFASPMIAPTFALAAALAPAAPVRRPFAIAFGMEMVVTAYFWLTLFAGLRWF